MEAGFEVKNNNQVSPSCFSFFSLQMERLTFFLNYSSSNKITKIRNEKKEGRESKEIKDVEEEA